MRTTVLITGLIGILIAVIVWREVRWRRQFEAVLASNETLTEKVEATAGNLAETEHRLQSIQEQTSAATIAPVAPVTVNVAALTNRIASLETEIQQLVATRAARGDNGSIPEYNPDEPKFVARQSSEAAANPGPRRSWGEEQIVGPPDTDRAGDVPTAWASREPDAGAEWLAAGFESVVDIAEVRIRETYNPGAISKVTAVVNGSEMTLWEGTSDAGAAPRDFVVKAPLNVTADAVIVYLDTTRVRGWNEIDAIEVVGRDGQRHWAASASASSTYAEHRTETNPPQ